jgi:hypothetical protein
VTTVKKTRLTTVLLAAVALAGFLAKAKAIQYGFWSGG